MDLVLAFDNDEAGQKATERAAKIVHEFNTDPNNKIIYQHPDPKASEQEQVDYDLDMHEMIKEIKDGQPKHSDVGWLQIFPQAKKTFGPFIKLRLQVRREILKIEYKILEEDTISQLKRLPPDEEWRDELIKEGSRRRLKAINKEISAIHHQLLLLRQIGKSPEKIKAEEKNINITQAMIDKAREYPVERLIEVNRQGFTKCFNHNDKKPSAYCKKNFVHCFVCQKSWDTIQILIDRDGLTFRQAVLHLQ